MSRMRGAIRPARTQGPVDEKGVIVRAWYNVKPEDTVPKARDALEQLSAAK